VVSEKALAAATIEPAAYESRSLDLKGLSEPVAVRVIVKYEALYHPEVRLKGLAE
jgi:hypothetical protein